MSLVETPAMVHPGRSGIAGALERLVARLGEPAGEVAGLCGFDGFIDTLISVDAPDTMAAFGPAVAAAAGIATSYPVRHRGEKFGGNGPLLAAALHDILGGRAALTYAGGVGRDAVLPIFREALGERMRRIIALADPARSECLEFRDGKVMLSDMRACAGITWERLEACAGGGGVDAVLRGSRFIAAVNWGKLAHAGEIWTNLAARLAALGAAPKSVLFFMDLAEFEQRPPGDTAQLPAMLARITAQCDTILSLNLKEAWQLASVVGADFHGRRAPADVAALATCLRQRLEVDRIIVHPNDGAACASARGTVHVPGPVCREPLISIGAGDHFGAGCLAMALRGGDDVEILLGGVCSSGFFVRSGRSPTPADFGPFARRWIDGTLPERW